MPTPTQREHPLEALLRPKALVVTVLASEALAVILSLAHPLDAGWPVRFGLLSLSLLWITIASLCGLALSRPLLHRLPAAAFPWFSMAWLVLATGGVAHAGWSLTRTLSGEAYSMFMLRVVTTSLVVGMLALLIYQNYLQGREAAIRHKEAELAVLRARVQPHFLFNTLNTGIALLHGQPERAERLLLDLSDLFRATFSGPAVGPLRTEIALARQYLAIESLRFAQRLEVHWTLPDEGSPLLETPLPALSLQPLVENAIKHGIEPSLIGGRVEVSVDTLGRHVRIHVRNTVPDPPPTTSRGHGIGVEAVRARIEAFGDGSGRLHTGHDATGDFVATLTLAR